MMSVAAEIPEGPMTAEAFFAFIDARPWEKWELIDGIPELIKRETPPDPQLPSRPQAMGGATLRHGILSGNIADALGVSLRKKGCRVLRDVFVRAVNPDGSENFMDPDVMIRCGPVTNDLDRSIEDPLVVFEVLSPSTLSRDRGIKFNRYKSLESLRQIILVYPDEYRVESFSPDAAGSWATAPRLLTRLDDSLLIAETGTELAISEIYEGVALGEG